MIFVGIDQSLTACGLCVLDERGQVIIARTIRPGKQRGLGRVAMILQTIDESIREHFTWRGDALVILEGAAHGAPGRDPLTKLAGVIEWHLWTQGALVCDYAPPPATLAKYHTGSGGGSTEDKKRRMLEAASSAGVNLIDDNAADAWGLARLLWDAWRGVRGGTLQQEETLSKVRPWVHERRRKGVSA